MTTWVFILLQGLLRESEPGTYLVRVSESRFGYSLSHVYAPLTFRFIPLLIVVVSVAPGKIKHYMIEQTINNEYQVVGNPKTFRKLSRPLACIMCSSNCSVAQLAGAILLSAQDCQRRLSHVAVPNGSTGVLCTLALQASTLTHLQEGETDLEEFIDKKKKKK